MTEALSLETAECDEQLKEQGERRLNVSGVQNILDEQFNPAEPDAVWCSDITYIWTFAGFVYLTSIMDLY